MKTGEFSRDASSGGGSGSGHVPEEYTPVAGTLPSSPDAKIRPFANEAIWQVIPAEKSHIPAIAADMREADRREVWAGHRHTPEEALVCSLARSELAWTCTINGRPAFMWGVARMGSMISLKGAPWLLGTNLFFRTHRTLHREFLRKSPDYVARMQQRFPRLENFVHAENRLSIRWLTWCGFTVDAAPVLINGEPFFMFWKNGRTGSAARPVPAGGRRLARAALPPAANEPDREWACRTQAPTVI